MKKLKEKKFIRNLMLLNPKNLASEVNVYGYRFSWKSHILALTGTLLGISAIGILFKLKPVYFSAILLVVGLSFPVFIVDMYKRMFEQKRFADAVTYAEQVLYSFQKNGKVLSSLKETREIFEEGRMRWKIEDAIRYLETGSSKTEKGILREALDFIEKPYACTKIHMIHELLISNEEYGGDAGNSILLVLNDIELWKRRGYKLQADKKVSHSDNVVSIAVATILCAVALYVLDGMGKMFPNVKGMDIFSLEITQISSFVFILFLLYVLSKSIKNLTINWLQSDSLQEENYILSSYDTVRNYDEGKEKKKSIIFSAPFFIASIPAFYFEKIWIGTGCLIVAAFMLLQHKIGYNLAKKDVNKELYLALPQWLMEIALLLQTNNVQVSIRKSIQEAPVILQRELLLLAERLEKEPGRLSSYTEFCREFDVPEIQSCMKMLHAISESGTGNSEVQIHNLIQRVHEMQTMADNIRSENMAFRMKMIFSYPVIAATIKLLIDLAMGMVYMLQLIGTMGG